MDGGLDLAGGIDRALGLYERALFWVDYYAPGDGRGPEVCAAVHLPDRPTVPLGIVPQGSGSDQYRITLGTFSFPGVIVAGRAAARLNAQQRAFGLGIGLATGDPEVAGLVREVPPFAPGRVRFSARGYLAAVGERHENVLLGVAHFAGGVRPPVGFFVLSQESDGQQVYIAGFQPEQQLEYVAIADSSERAGYVASQIVVPVSALLHELALAEGEEAERLRGRYEELLRELRFRFRGDGPHPAAAAATLS